MKDKIERWLHLNMALIGGFMGGYAILNRSDLFGSAETSNMISLAMDALGRQDSNWWVRLIALLLYMAGLASTVILPHKIKHLNLKVFSIIVDAIALVLAGFLPADLNPFVALYPLFIATSIQWCSFSGAEGFTSSSIFSTNNLRQCTTAFTEYFCTKNPEALRKGKFFGKVLLSYHLGVAFAFISSQTFGLKASWVMLLPLCSALFLEHMESSVKVHVPAYSR